MYLTYTLTCTSGSFYNGNDLVKRTISSFCRLIARFLHRQSDVNLRATCVLHQRILLLHKLQQLLAIHRLSHLAFFWFANASIQNLCNVLLLHKVLVQLLNAFHFQIIKPVGGLHLTQFVEYLSIKLLVIDVAFIIDELTLRNLQADIAIPVALSNHTQSEPTICPSTVLCQQSGLPSSFNLLFYVLFSEPFCLVVFASVVG